MKDLVFSISFKNHTFNIRTTPRSTLCYYHNEGKYTTSLVFGSKTYAYVEHKNVRFSGTVTKQNIWSVSLDYHPVFGKRFNSYYFISNESAQNKEKTNATCNITTEYPDKILWLYNQLIETLHKHYLCIEDKETFKHQLCEVLFESYMDDEIEDLDTIVEYENWNDVEPDEEPIIEKTSIKNILIEECQNYFICFRQAEIDSKNKNAIITLENIINEVPSLFHIPYELLQKEFCRFLDKNYADLIKPNIWYIQEEMLMDIGREIYKSCQYALFINNVEEKIDKILLSMHIEYIDKDELYSYFKSKYSKDSLPSDEAFELNVIEVVNEHVTYNQTYRKFVSLFNNNHIKIEWNDEKLCLFQKYDKEGQIADPQNFAEYEVYKYVIPFYRKNFLYKNSNRYKPVIEKLPVFISYASTVLDILFKHKIITINGDVVVYNNNGNIELACKEIKALEGNFS